MADIKYWPALKRVPRLEPYFGDLEQVWHAGLSEFKETGLDDRTGRDLIDLRSRTSPDAELEKLKRAGIKLVTWHND